MQLSNAVGKIALSISSDIEDLNIIVFIDDRTISSSHVSQFFTNSQLTWSIHESGNVAIISRVVVSGTDRWDEEVFVTYGNHVYQYFVSEAVKYLQCYGHGGYSGSLMNW